MKPESLYDRIEKQLLEHQRANPTYEDDTPIAERKKNSVGDVLILGRSKDIAFAGKDEVPCPFCNRRATFVTVGLNGDVYWCTDKKCFHPFNEKTWHEMKERIPVTNKKKRK